MLPFSVMQPKKSKLSLDFKGLPPNVPHHRDTKLVTRAKEKLNELQEDDIIDIEEESQIESSLPVYMDHIYGTSFTFNVDQAVGEVTQDRKYSKEIFIEKAEVGPFDFCNEVMYNENTNLDSNSSAEHVNNSNALSMLSDTQGGSIKNWHTPELPMPVQSAVNSGLSCDITAERKVAVSCDTPSRKRKRINVVDNMSYRQPPGCVLLRDCIELDKTVDVLALVLQVNSPMSVVCKKGTVAGQTVLMSSILLADPSRAYFKLSLWREAASWAERVTIGDIVYLRKIRLKVWNNEVVGTTVKYSSLLNLHQPSKKLPQKVLDRVPENTLSSFMDWGRKSFAYLFSSPPEPKSQRDVEFHTAQEFAGKSVVHLRAKLLCIISCRVVLMADGPDYNIHIHLIHPPAPQWHSELSAGLGEVWECLYMAVVQDETCTQNSSGTYTLQTTYRTTLRRLSISCPLALDIIEKFPLGEGRANWVTSCPSLAHMIQSQQSGIYEVDVKALKFEFILPNSRKFHLCSSSNNGMLLSQSVYVGCETCSSPLSQDENGIYRQCMPCITKAPGRGYPNSAYFFRPLLVTLQDPAIDLTVPVSASHVVVPKVLRCSARDVVQASLSESKLEIDLINEKARWVIRCIISKDENSFVEEVSYTLLDVHKIKVSQM